MPNATSSQSPAVGADSAHHAAKTAGPDPLLGRTINERFKISALIARGGMGKVYRAEQSPLGRICAVKVLNPSYSGEHDPEFHKRFFLEASISARLTHPNTVTIFDYGRTDDNVYFMAMEYLEGRTLHRTLREEGPFTEERAMHIARQICRSLREAHSLGVIHRDLKPANVFLIEHGDEPDFVKVLDFGLVKNIDETKGEDLTQTGLFMGSPKYMAPEQIRGEHVDARTDIYALGIMMYEMVTGKVPFDRPNSVNILMAHVNEAVPPLREMNPHVTINEAFEQAILRCVEKEPEARFRSMDEVLGALKRAGAPGATRTGTFTGSVPPVYSERGLEPLSGPHSDASLRGRTASGSYHADAQVRSLSPEPSSSGVANVFGLTTAGTSVPSVPPFEQKKSRASLIIGAAAAGVLLVVAAIFASTRGSTSTKPAVNGSGATLLQASPGPSPSPSAITDIPAIAVSAPPREEATARLAIETDPPGAQVKDEETIVCDKTPCEVIVGDKPRKLRLDLKDYKSESISVRKGDPARSVHLSKAAVWIPRPPTTGKPTGDEPKPTFKDNPY